MCNLNLHIILFKEKKRKIEAPVPTRVGKKRRAKGPDAANKLPAGLCPSCLHVALVSYRVYHLYLCMYVCMYAFIRTYLP